MKKFLEKKNNRLSDRRRENFSGGEFAISPREFVNNQISCGEIEGEITRKVTLSRNNGNVVTRDRSNANPLLTLIPIEFSFFHLSRRLIAIFPSILDGKIVIGVKKSKRVNPFLTKRLNLRPELGLSIHFRKL